MPVLVDILAKPKRSNSEALGDALFGVGAAAEKGGNLNMDWLVGWSGGSLRLTGEMPYRDSLSRKYWSTYLIESWEQLCACTANTPAMRAQSLGPARAKSAPKLSECAALYVQADYLGILGTVHESREGREVPSYLLLLGDDQREELYFWTQQSRGHDQVWMASGALANAAYAEMADPRSDLSERGRRCAELISQTTGIPTYYWLPRYYGRKDDARKWRCPGCGGRWAREAGEQGLEKFSFRCDRCLLVSYAASDFDEPKLASVGAWRRGRKAL